MSFSVKNVSRSLKNVGNIFKNDILTNFVLILTIALSVGYLVNKTYHALVILYVMALLIFLICKNIACALGISIILTNLFLSLKIIDVKENFEDKNDIINMMKKSNSKQEKTKEKIKKIEKKEKKN
tara:strand:- start:27500 stop:27877 length:378 start_codon:yes stop_codon:yes gene_type:complete